MQDQQRHQPQSYSRSRVQTYVRRPMVATVSRVVKLGTSQQETREDSRTKLPLRVRFESAVRVIRKATRELLTNVRALGSSEHLRAKLQRQWQLVGLAALTVVLVGSSLVPAMLGSRQAGNYSLDKAKSLLTKTPEDLQKKLSYDTKEQAWVFNQSPQSVLPVDNGDSVSVGALTYSASLPSNVHDTKGVTITDTQSKLSIILTPRYQLGSAQKQDGHVVYPIAGSDSQLVYTFEHNGLKEDIVLYRSPGDSAEFSYDMQLPTGMEARLQKDGSVGIFGGDPTLFGNITYGSDKDQALVEKARQNSKKDHLYYVVPAPAITGDKTNTVKAKFVLDGSILTVKVAGLSGAHYPLSIDPSFVMDTTGCSWQTGGNNEDSNTNFSGCQLARSNLSGGVVGSWNSAGPVTPFSPSRMDHGVTVSNGYVYLIAGASSNGSSITNTNTVQYAQITTSGTIGTWNSTNALPDSKDNNNAVQSYNGYIYVMGGTQGATNASNNVWYAAVCTGTNTTTQFSTNCSTSSTPGTTSSWSAANTGASFTARLFMSSAVYNGYMYIIAGCPSTTGAGCSTTNSMLQDVNYAKINADGTLGAWTSAAGTFGIRYLQASIASNGYLYILGGCTVHVNLTVNCQTTSSDVWYAPLNPTTGAPGTWVQTSSLGTAILGGVVSISNNFLYLMGGCTQATGGPTCNQTTPQTVVQLAQIYANGSVGSWNTTTALSPGRSRAAGFAYSGYQFIIGGCANNSVNCNSGSGSQNDSISALISTALGNTSGYGATSTWDTAGRTGQTTVSYGGYIYIIGGTGSNAGAATSMLNTTRYAPINTDGTIGAWSTASATFNNVTSVGGDFCSGASSCPGRVEFAARAYNGYMYMAGGWTNASGTARTFWSDVQSAVICTGTNTPVTGCAGAGDLRGTGGAATWTNQLADFVTNSTTVYNDTDGRSKLAMEIYNGYMYIIGGRNDNGNPGGANVVLANIYVAPLTSGGGVGTFTATTSLPSGTGRAEPKTFISNGRLYVVGGNGTGAGSEWTWQSQDLDDVWFIPIKSDGTLDGTVGWKDANSAGNGGSGSSFVAADGLMDYNVNLSKGYVYITGGQNGAGGSNTYATVYKAQLNSNGSLGSWSSINSFTTARYDLGTVIAGGYLYIIGGCSARGTLGTSNCSSIGQMLNTYQYSEIYNGAGGRSKASATTTGLSTGLKGVMGAATNGYVYYIGGATSAGTAQTTVKYAQATGAGTLSGSWTSTASLNTARYDAAVTLYNGYIYVLGGYDGSSVLSTGEYAKVNGDGTLSSWTQFNMADSREAAAAFAYNGYLYIAGGTSNGSTGLSTVKYAQLSSSSGVPGSWSSTTAGFTNARYGLNGFSSSNGSVYIMGGYDGSSYYSDVQYAVPTGSGDITSWSYGPSFQFARTRFSLAVANGYVYLYSGKDASGARSDIMYASIMSSGNLGRWDYAGTISGTAEYWGGSASTGGYLYLLGGSPDGTNTTTTVNYVPLLGTPDITRYSMVLKTDKNTTPATVTSTLGLESNMASVNLSLATATLSAGTFSTLTGAATGMNSATKYNLPISGDGGSYYWVFITLDDSQAATFGESAGTNMSYLQLNYHANSTMRLRGGKTFNSNRIQSLDAP